MSNMEGYTNYCTLQQAYLKTQYSNTEVRNEYSNAVQSPYFHHQEIPQTKWDSFHILIMRRNYIHG